MNSRVVLKNAGLKITTARVAVLDILALKNNPLDIASIAKGLHEADILVDTVTLYRIAEVFKASGLVNRVDFGEGKFRYELSRNEHHHFLCENCGAVAEIDNCPVSELELSIQKERQVLIKRHSLEFFGLCTDCQVAT